LKVEIITLNSKIKEVKLSLSKLPIDMGKIQSASADDSVVSVLPAPGHVDRDEEHVVPRADGVHHLQAHGQRVGAVGAEMYDDIAWQSRSSRA
jgi:hypothetical protein